VTAGWALEEARIDDPFACHQIPHVPLAGWVVEVCNFRQEASIEPRHTFIGARKMMSFRRPISHFPYSTIVTELELLPCAKSRILPSRDAAMPGSWAIGLAVIEHMGTRRLRFMS
jgi:hypothetical protein